MNMNRTILVLVALLATGIVSFAAGRSASQEAPATPASKELQWLDSLAGEYNIKMGGVTGEADGTSTVETSLGGLWSIRRLETTAMGQPFTGLELLGYDPLKKKFVSAWVDSMTPLLVTSEGTYDADSNTLTMHGISRGMDGEEAEMVNTMEFGDDGMLFTMNIEGVPLVTVEYVRKEG